MITSSDVFAKRRAGAIDEAYAMALQLMSKPESDEWDRKAMGWCLVDLIKRDATAGQHERLEQYRSQLEGLQVAADDEVLQKGIRKALLLCSPSGGLIQEASERSRQGAHAQAVDLYRRALNVAPLDAETQTNFGWDLYRHAKQLLDAEHVNFAAVKRNLNDYLRLDTEKPSMLHACFLQLAAKLASQEKLSMLKFCRLWNLEHLRAEDFERYVDKEGKEHPSLAERVIQQAGKEAGASGDLQDVDHILPYLDAAIERFPDNIWLQLDKAKVLRRAGRQDEALKFAMTVAKAKANEYWAWELLGDIVAGNDPASALDCYCKALCCPAEDKFTGKLRLKLAQLMITANELAAAKHEVERVLRQREQEGQRVPEDVAQISRSSWFSETQATASNGGYYRSHAGGAEALLLGGMPWIAANAGNRYVVPGKENKPRRKIFVRVGAEPMEASIPESRLGTKDIPVGSGLQVKGELDEGKHFKIYAIELRATKELWDVFPDRIAIVDRVNREKGVLHFVVDRQTDGVLPLAELGAAFKEGDAIAVRMCRSSAKEGKAYRVLDAHATDEVPSTQLRKEFSEAIRLSDGMGFTPGEIFVPPPLVELYGIRDGQQVSGTAILTFNKKRQCFGWKAVSVSQVE